MRTIKFRGLRVDGKGWVYGDLKRENDNRWGGRRTYIWIDTDDCEEDGDYVEIDWQSIGQFTGLTDKNGLEIYEGDWLQCPGYACRVEFIDGGFHTIYTHPEDSETLPIIDVSPSSTMSVVGNIHEK